MKEYSFYVFKNYVQILERMNVFAEVSKNKDNLNLAKRF